ncbi:hypothetical protein ACQ33O_00190 [Ferruginibacter sp. SUN002]|uniref:hypothetical protein n=1 Tax=Ferruginibacter sp. SUN002 TaxID=2937789 RepID=UPI003D35FEF9
MKKFISIITILFLCSQLSVSAQERQIGKGTSFIYAVKEGAKGYKVEATVKEWNEKGNVRIDWRVVDSKAKPKSSVFPYTAVMESGSINIKPTFVDEKLGKYESRWLLGYNFFYDMYDLALDMTVSVDGVSRTFSPDEYETDKTITYNGEDLSMTYALGVYDPGDTKITLGLVEFNYSTAFLGYYADDKFSIELLSIKNPFVKKETPKVKEEPVKKDEVKSKEVKLTKMDAAKFAKVKIKYPLLSKVDTYDATDGGKVSKPITETYEYRITSGKANPPSLIDCLTADLRIIYKQAKNFSITDLEAIDEKSFPASAVKKILNVYITIDYMKIPGYRPWSNWRFVRSLKEKQLDQLSREVEGYIAKYGFLENL